jgi:hypothetical protein
MDVATGLSRDADSDDVLDARLYVTAMTRFFSSRA